MTRVRLVVRMIVCVLFALFGVTTVARAQSVVEGFDPGANREIFAVAVQPDGRILVGGGFSALGGGGTGNTARNGIGRLNADGSLDTSFNPGVDGVVEALAVQADGKILVGGYLTGLGGGTGTTPRRSIGRLNADGSVDTSFDPGTNGTVMALAVQADGKILIGGLFTALGGAGTTPRRYLGRLNADGSLDASFDAGVDADPTGGSMPSVQSIALQPDGKIVIGGSFTLLAGTTPRRGIGRLNADGSLDRGFNRDGTVFTISDPAMPKAIALQPDGKIVIGRTSSVNCRAIVRLNADGSLDAAFNTTNCGWANALALQADGKIIVGGRFSQLGGGTAAPVPRTNIGRFNADGSVDATFDAGADGFEVNAFAVRPDGTLLVGGGFLTLGRGVGSRPRRFIGLLASTNPASEGIRVTGGGSIVTWARGGSGPELSWATFEVSSDGTTYTPLASGTSVRGGWQTTGQHLAVNQPMFIRTRGYYTTGIANGSGSVVEAIHSVLLVPPTISHLPNVPTRKGTSITIPFTVGSAGNGAAAVTVVASSSNTAQVPNANLMIGGTGANRTLTVVPSPHQLGRTTITLTANDDGLTTTTSFVLVVYGSVRGDFTGHGKAHVTVFRPSTGTWFIADPVSGATSGVQWGNGLDVPEPGDYDGDGQTDVAVFRPSNGTWYIVNSSTGVATGMQWGNGADVPVPADFDGDGKTDIAVFRPSNGTWFIVNSSTGGAVGVQWGNGLDRPVPGDYDGDGKADVAVFRPSTGTWFIINSSTAAAAGFEWGNGADVAVPGDYDGDGRTDIAVFRPSTGTWFMVNSGTGAATGFQWGNGADVPVPGDYDGDGRTDIAVFRPSTGTWFMVNSGTGAATGFQWGNGADIPILKR